MPGKGSDKRETVQRAVLTRKDERASFVGDVGRGNTYLVRVHLAAAAATNGCMLATPGAGPNPF